MQAKMNSMNQNIKPLTQLEREYEQLRRPLGQIGLISQGSVQDRTARRGGGCWLSVDAQGGPKNGHRLLDLRTIRQNEGGGGQLPNPAPPTQGTGKALSTHYLPGHPTPEPSQAPFPEGFRH